MKKKIISTLLTLSILGTGLCLPAISTQASTNTSKLASSTIYSWTSVSAYKTVYANDYYLSVRNDLSTNSTVIASIPNGAKVFVLNKTNAPVNGYIWATIIYNGITGYVPYEFLG